MEYHVGMKALSSISTTNNDDRPNTISVDVENMYGGDHNLLFTVTFNNIINSTILNLSPLCKQIMIYVGEMGERLLPTNANKYFINGVGKVIQDKTFTENFLYSCCEMVTSSPCYNNTVAGTIQCQYNCPAAPAAELNFMNTY